MTDEFKYDWERYYRKSWSAFSRFYLLKSKSLRFIYSGRQEAKAKNRICKIFWRMLTKKIGQSLGNEIGFAGIGPGLVITHPYSITVNSGTKAGINLTLFKGCTIGSIRSGSKAGVPTLGDNVTVCCNAFICGNITIGNDVFIAANSYVNFDVPDNSIVIGNPGIIHHKENPCKDYI